VALDATGEDSTAYADRFERKKQVVSGRLNRKIFLWFKKGFIE
jgi:hypothetical protein